MAKKKNTTKSTAKKTAAATAVTGSKPAIKTKTSSVTRDRNTKKSAGAVAKAGSVAPAPTPGRKKKKSASGAAARSAGNRKTTTSPPLAPVVKNEQSPEEHERAPLTVTQLRKVKTSLTRKGREHYRQLLLQKRTEILGDVQALETDARSDSGDHLSPEHMADIGSTNYEQEFALGLVETERKMVAEIDAALIRIRERTYGVCLERGVRISKARLDAKPWARYCIEVAREKESRGEI